MGDRSHAPQVTPRQDTPTPSTNGGVNGTAVQDRNLRGQGRRGNAAVAQDAGLTGRPDDIDPMALLGEDETWRGRGNLIGNPPVRDEENPPNKGIVEDQAVYNQRYAAAAATMQTQQARADAMLDGDGNVTDNRYWFTRVYQFVTRGELEEARGATFYYPSYVMQSVRYFDQIYADNLVAADNGGTVEDHWARAFDVAADEHETTLVSGLSSLVQGGMLGGGFLAGGLLGLGGGSWLASATEDVTQATESLVASMQAHIRYDLPRAEAWVFRSYYSGMEDAKMANFQPDFMSMSGIFDRAATDMNDEIADRTNLPVDWMPRMLQDWAMDYMLEANMSTERADTWERAESLAENGLEGNDPYMDTGTSLSGDVTSTQQPAGTGLQHLPEANLRPTMADPAEVLDDNAVREDVARNGTAKKTTGERIRMIRGLLAGATFDDDENTLLEILRGAVVAGDVVTVIDGANAWDMAYATDGDEFDELRSFFQQRYYGRTSRSMAVTLIRRCMDGETAEWEEEMVADLLVARHGVDGAEILTEIGRVYDEGGYAEGLNKVQWQLDGEDQDRVDDLYDV
ncbi:MAG: DUF5995 family protein [Pseudomonadota bacterium]|nr:DUF5995 family protein [Pseudomonadota bacterium]